MAESSTDRVHPHTHELRESDGTWKYTNRLADQTSPYLLQHAHNPVDWHAWGPEAFDLARREGKPIFLSVGYSTCYWCHVMERQVFENPVIAEQMNRQFVNVKVDREERPDVDDLYMTATQMLSGHGGWPMSVFLTPPGSADEDGEAARGLMPFWAGTYLPPEPTRGMPSFPQVLDALSQAWQEQPGQVIDQAKRIAEAVTRHLEHRDLSGPLSVEPVERTANQLLQLYDHEHGGFGEAPKFPQPTNLAFMLAVYRHSHDEEVWHAVAHTLARMARGGIYDQIGGGFHRYSVDERWLVPHFEKMLYDNGQLVELYVDAYAERAEEADATLYERVVRETCDYVLREMVDETGAFWSAQDAEVRGREGENYLWTRAQIEQALDDPQLAVLAVRLYGLDQGPNFQDPHDPDAQPVNVLHLPQSLPQLAAALEMELPELIEARQRINDRLKIARDQRDQPITDDKTLIAWNGMMIAGLARAGRILDEPRFLAAAVRAAEAILQHMTSDDHGLLRSMREGEAGIPAFLEDYVYFVHALIELHRAAPADDDGRYLQLARQYTEAARVRFAADVGGYYDMLADQGDLFVRVRMLHDGVIASGNSVMVHNLLDLYELTHQRVFIEQAVRDLHAFGQVLVRQGAAMVHLQHALLRGLELAPELFQGDSIAALSAAQQPVRIEIDPPDLDLSAGEAGFVVTLHIDEQYHLNAEDPRGAGGPGGRNFIPTTLELTGPSGLALSVGYPDGEPRRFAYADQELIVYEGTIALHATLRQQSDAAPAGPARLVLRYQACTDQACLAPRTLELSVPISSGAGRAP